MKTLNSNDTSLCLAEVFINKHKSLIVRDLLYSFGAAVICISLYMAQYVLSQLPLLFHNLLQHMRNFLNILFQNNRCKSTICNWTCSCIYCQAATKYFIRFYLVTIYMYFLQLNLMQDSLLKNVFAVHFLHYTVWKQTLLQYILL